MRMVTVTCERCGAKSEQPQYILNDEVRTGGIWIVRNTVTPPTEHYFCSGRCVKVAAEEQNASTVGRG